MYPGIHPVNILMKYFTGKGDKGKTTIAEKKISKDNFVFEVLGELDELNSLIGLAKNYLPKKFYLDLTKIQNNLFIIQANVAYFLYKKFEPPKLKKEEILNLEEEIKKIETKVPSHKFIIYGSNKDSAWLDYLRAVTRRVERRIVKFLSHGFTRIPKQINTDDILAYLNRLSSYFYALARFICYNKKIKEKEPWY
ncbi:MAG: ATP:cob(I)alamin adenosyltransferase [Candidatus Parcubacteria bacterium]|nr:MAG: ATP:cob(I)alamin adenosyltransferase [Candidatus Parcubacteria bacterium]